MKTYLMVGTERWDDTEENSAIWDLFKAETDEDAKKFMDKRNREMMHGQYKELVDITDIVIPRTVSA